MGEKILLKNTTIIAPNQELNGQQKDILISASGVIEKIGTLIADKARVLDIPDLHICPGLMDIGVFTGDPGYESQEDLQHVEKAANAGGFTAIATLPNTNPVAHTKSDIAYVKNVTASFLTEYLPIGAVSMDCAGKDLTEMIDMSHAGAVAFSDGLNPIQDAGMLLRALQYVKAIDGLIINTPIHHSISAHGQIHEGSVSVALGMTGIPPIAETLAVQRDIQLAKYAGSKLHISNISTAESVELIRDAKQSGVQVTASVPVLNLMFTDEQLFDFDTLLKVFPPLRDQYHLQALIEGLRDRTIDFITSQHLPQEEDAKNLEFPYAAFGSIGLETAFAASWSALKDVISLDQFIESWSGQTRKLFSIEVPMIKEGALANMTLFRPHKKWTVSQADIYSKSCNTPLLGKELTGKIVGVIRGSQSNIF